MLGLGSTWSGRKRAEIALSSDPEFGKGQSYSNPDSQTFSGCHSSGHSSVDTRFMPEAPFLVNLLGAGQDNTGTEIQAAASSLSMLLLPLLLFQVELSQQ